MISLQNGVEEYVDLEDSAVIHDEKAAMLEEFERKRRARQMHVPTEDSEVSRIHITYIIVNDQKFAYLHFKKFPCISCYKLLLYSCMYFGIQLTPVYG